LTEKHTVDYCPGSDNGWLEFRVKDLTNGFSPGGLGMTINSQGQRFLSVSPKFGKSSCWGLALGMALLVFFLSASVHAVVFTVNSPSDPPLGDANPGDGVCLTSNGLCTLRAAIQETNALLGADTIILPPNTYLLTEVAELLITDNLTITGSGASTTIIDGNGSLRPSSGGLRVGVRATVTITSLTVINGFRLEPNGLSGGGLLNSGILTISNSSLSGRADFGGAIANDGTMTLINSTVRIGIAFKEGGGIYNNARMTLVGTTVNFSNQAAARGGGIFNIGTMTLTNSTVSSNSATWGGGIFNAGTLTLTNSTVSENGADQDGGGIYNENFGRVNLFNVTMTRNQADRSFRGMGIGGGIFNGAIGAPFTFQNTILAGNSETLRLPNGIFIATTGECAGGTIGSSGNNLMENYNTGHCTVVGTAPILADPKLGPLQNNGGPTQTHGLLAGSPAIDGGNLGGCRDNLGVLLPTDQRGFPRTFGSRCDIGAYEVFTGSATSVVAALLPSSRSVQVGVPATAFATVINTGQGTAAACSIAPLTNVPAVFQYQTTDSGTNQVVGFPNTAASIAAGASQSFVFAVTPTAPIASTDVQFSFDCANSDPAPVNSGLNTLLLSASDTAVPDIVALAAANAGIVDIPGTNGTGVFAVATVNVGASATITASADTGAAVLPVNIFLCETNPSTGQCISGIGPSVSTTINAGATPTFGIFVQGNGNVPFDPAGNRIFVRFKDGGVTRGSTSVAVRTQ
jgi:hypothetical protein